MIPIIYGKDETAFVSNGLGRLRDCISCVVTEERNGIYECNFEYPMDGANFDQIQCGRIIGVTHDETGDVQPFDIVGYTQPIGGVVSFHAVHVSYRQSYITTKGTDINSLADAFTLLGTGQPSNPFAYETDKTSTGFLSCANGLPHSVREMLGGIEGSILDAYGGEYEWDKFVVRLHEARGRNTDFTIRYGVNMLNYNDETDHSGCYSSCIPFWTDGNESVVGDRVVADGTTVTARGECVPLDLSDKFQTKPTKAQVQSMALSYMTSNNTFMPNKNIKVEFVRLQDDGVQDGLDLLMKCALCDTVNVVFPGYDASGNFKIVKTEWDVLQGKYKSMELGTLAPTLAQALGIDNTHSESSGGMILYYVDTFTPTGYSFNANEYKSLTRLFTSRDGYTPIIVQATCSNKTSLHVINYYIDDNSIKYEVINRTGSSISGANFTLKLLWLKTVLGG